MKYFLLLVLNLTVLITYAQPQKTIEKAKKYFENGKGYKALNMLKPYIVEDSSETYALTYSMMANLMCPDYRVPENDFMIEATRLYIKAGDLFAKNHENTPSYAELTYEYMEPFYNFLDNTFEYLHYSSRRNIDFDSDEVWNVLGQVESVSENKQFRMDYYEACLEYSREPQNLRDTAMYDMMKFAYQNSAVAWKIFKNYYEQGYRTFEMEDGSVTHVLNYYDDNLLPGAIAEYYPFIEASSPSSFATVVHESTHRNNYIESGRSDGLFEHTYAYFTTPKGIVKVRLYDKLNSIYLKEYLPDSLTDEIFRFNAYIANEGNNMSSQVDGIYGLLDEMCAYYHETQALWDAKEAYADNSELKNALAEGITAFYEFQFFTNQYLKMIEEEYNWALSNLRNDNDFRIAFTFIYDAYEKLVNEAEPFLIEHESFQTNTLAKTKRLLADYDNAQLVKFLFPLALEKDDWRQFAKYNDK